MPLRLEIISQGRRLPQVSLRLGQRLAIGRDPECHVILEDPHLSRRQLTVRAESGGQVEFISLGSKNPLLFDGRAVDRAHLKAGEEIRVGETVLLVRDDPKGPPSVVLVDSRSKSAEDRWVVLDAQDSDSWWSESDFQDATGDASSRATEHLAGLFEISRALARRIGPNELLDRLMDVVFETLPVSRSFLELGDPMEGQFEVVKLQVRDSSQTTIEMSQTILEEIRRGAKGILVPDVQESFRVDKHPSVASVGIQAFMAVPLTVGTRTVGVIYADQLGDDRPLDLSDLRYLQSLAHLIACALDGLAANERASIGRRSLPASLKSREEFVAESPAMLDVIEEAKQAGLVDSPLLIEGEVGTGREHLARLIHEQSERRSGPFVVFHCGATAGADLDRELFGHVEADTAAEAPAQHGQIVAASGGTLFLDGLGELPADAQAKLVRIVQEGKVRPTGSSAALAIDARIIAAADGSLSTLRKQGKFREDLYYLLAVLNLNVPPLRNRPEDVIALIHQRLPDGLEVTEAVERALQTYSWPGNVRELLNVLERIALHATGGRVLLKDLPSEVAQEGRRPALEVALRSLAEIELDHIQRVLRRVDGNKKRAAQILGISRETLYKKLKQV